MANNTRDLLLYSRLIDLHRRKTEAELMGYCSRAYQALIEIYEMELAEIEEDQSKRSPPDAA
jgi:hypothetical protein